MFFSNRLARFVSSLPRFSGVSCLHEPSKALRAAATAMSTSFSVASWTEVITFSSAGLMVSKVLPSARMRSSMSSNLGGQSARMSSGCEDRLRDIGGVSSTSGAFYLQAGRLLVLAGVRRLKLDGSHIEAMCLVCWE